MKTFIFAPNRWIMQVKILKHFNQKILSKSCFFHFKCKKYVIVIAQMGAVKLPESALERTININQYLELSYIISYGLIE